MVCAMLRHTSVKFKPFLIKPLSLFLEEISISDKHSPDLAQILRFLLSSSFESRAMAMLDARARLQVLNSLLYQALHVFCLQLVEHWISSPIVINDLEHSRGVLGTNCLAVRIDSWRDTTAGYGCIDLLRIQKLRLL